MVGDEDSVVLNRRAKGLMLGNRADRDGNVGLVVELAYTEGAANRLEFAAADNVDHIFRFNRFGLRSGLRPGHHAIVGQRRPVGGIETVLFLETFDVSLAFGRQRSEEHTSELQSQMRISYAVSCFKQNK